MASRRKKVLLGFPIVLGVLLLLLGGAAFWFRELIFNSLANREVQGVIEAVPETTPAELPPLTRGSADWICWRGPAGDGRSLVTDIRTDWSGGLPKLWEIGFLCQDRAGATWSAPVIRGNRLVVCGRDQENDLVFCLSPEDGSLIWKASYPAPADRKYGRGARATPWIDGDLVYTFGRSGDLVCWRLLDGGKVWHRNVADEGGAESDWGHSSSPLVTETLVVVGGGGTARTIAFDKATGETHWKAGQGPAGYAAMVRMPIAGRPSVLAFHGKGLAAVDLETGRELWDTPWPTSYDVNATTPVVSGDRVFITSAYGSGGQLLEVGPDAATTVWKSDVIGSQHSDPILVDGHLYGYTGMSTQNSGDFVCVELATGAKKWSTDEMGWGTCVAVGEHLLCLDIKGNLFLMRPDPGGFDKVAEMRGIFGKVKGAVWTVPVLANGKLYLRFSQRLVCLDVTPR
jgi:outer membrane protein assembly factor BamB